MRDQLLKSNSPIHSAQHNGEFLMAGTYEEIAAECLSQLGEVALEDHCDEIDVITEDGDADQLVSVSGKGVNFPSYPLTESQCTLNRMVNRRSAGTDKENFHAKADPLAGSLHPRNR